MDCINFASKYFGTSIHTNIVTADGYEVENLLNDTLKGPSFPSAWMPGRTIGFMAEYFVKPPVDVVVQFPCLVDVDCLVVNCRTGSKKITNFDVSSACAKPICVRIQNQSNSGAKKEGPDLCSENSTDFPFQYQPDISSTEVRKQNISSLNTVGRFNSNYFSSDLVVFRNPKNSNGKGIEYQKNGRETMNFFSLKYLYGISHLVVRVYRTEGSTVVAINRIEVWGKPSRMNSRSVQNHVYGLERQQNQSSEVKECSISGNHKTNGKARAQDSEAQSLKAENSLEILKKNSKREVSIIPEEFIDKITCDLMVLPVLLPSGHTIDASTLEKCVNHDKVNGRAPSDPFTGVRFTENNKAVPNAALKTRLDKYVLENDTSLAEKCMRNTTGTKYVTCNTVDRIEYRKRKAPADQREGFNKKHREMAREVKNDKNIEMTTNVHEPNLSRENSPSNQIDCIAFTEVAATKNCHEETLKDSLETALQHTIKKLPRLSKATDKAKELQFFCCCCKEQNNEIGFFRMPCSHVMCRKCITMNASQSKCKTCHLPFSTHDLQRVHFNSYF